MSLTQHSYTVSVTLILSVTLGLFACSRVDPAQAKDGEAPKTAKAVQKVAKTTKAEGAKSAIVKRGAALPKGECLSLDQISADPEKYANTQVLVQGEVVSVCQAKGCWMSIKSETSNANARVTFKDYAFFVPKDSKGMTGKMSGVVKVKLLSEGERKHLAEDGRVDVSEIPKAELRIVAEGLELSPKG